MGARLAYLDFSRKFRWMKMAGAILFGLTTPIGIAVGLVVRTSYNPDSTTASIVSGVLNSLSAGILVYSGLVEVLSFLFVAPAAAHISHELCSSSPTNSYSIRT